MQEYEVIFEDGVEYIVEEESDFDARCEAENKYLYDHEPGFTASQELKDEFELPAIKSCVKI